MIIEKRMTLAQHEKMVEKRLIEIHSNEINVLSWYKHPSPICNQRNVIENIMDSAWKKTW
jgi:hypothetical protein